MLIRGKPAKLAGWGRRELVSAQHHPVPLVKGRGKSRDVRGWVTIGIGSSGAVGAHLVLRSGNLYPLDIIGNSVFEARNCFVARLCRATKQFPIKFISKLESRVTACGNDGLDECGDRWHRRDDFGRRTINDVQYGVDKQA